MNEVWKFPLRLGSTSIEMPAGARPLTVQMQHGVPTLWALVDAGRFPEARRFMLVGTGHAILRHDALYIATVQDAGGFVWHAFETP